ncbi:MAG: iron ABC transporter permease [Clostridia bacterium]|nr:iron ABC transporter permease [Clostridia bacterium]
MSILQNCCIPKSSRRPDRREWLFWILPLLAVAAFVLALLVGASRVDLGEALSAALAGERENTAYRIVFYLRLPRALGALLAGGALATAGVLLQAVLQNPMAAPNVIGVNAGAGFFSILAMALFPGVLGHLPLAAFLGALLAALLIYAVSAVTGAGRVTVTLVGVAVGSILTAASNTVKTLFPDSVYDISDFLIGGLSGVSLATVLPAAVMILPALGITLLGSRSLDVLSLGEEVAGGLGLRVSRVRLLWLLLSAVLAGAAVSFCGLIGFVGLIVPHVMRRLVGNRHRYLLPASIFGGGAFLLLADTVSRTLFSPYELPVGILLSLVGGPFFIGLVLMERRAKR